MNKQLMSKKELLNWINREKLILESFDSSSWDDYYVGLDKGQIYILNKIKELYYDK